MKIYQSRLFEKKLKKLIKAEKVALDREVRNIADNPNKDFIGIKPFGFKTIRVKRGMFSNIILDKSHEADITIHTLDELTDNLLKKLL